MIRGLSVALIMGFLSMSANAANYIFEPTHGEPQAFTFSFNSDYLSIIDSQGHDHSGYVYGLRFELIEHLLPYLHVAMALDRSASEQLMATNSRGYRFELSTALISPVIDRVRLAARVSYFHHRWEGEQSEYSMRLHGFESHGLAMIYLLDYIHVYGGFGITARGGSYTGESSGSYDYTANINKIYKAGIDILVEPGGHVGIESRYREKPSIEVYFQRRY